MKRSLFACAVATFAIAAMPIIEASAVSITGDQSHDVTVGEVAEVIYSVDIGWDDMIFDFDYDSATNTYGFKARIHCEPYYGGIVSLHDIFYSNIVDNDVIYSDSTCKTLYTGQIYEASDEEHFYDMYRTYGVSGAISVYDFSKNGKIKASAQFDASEKYYFIDGKFSSKPTLTHGTEIIYGEDLEDGVLPMNADSRCEHLGYLHLETKAGMYIPAELINADDKIGTVTLTITPDEN